MPTSDVQEYLLTLVKELRTENAALLEIILKQQRLLPEETVESLDEIPTSSQSIGKKPWYMLKAELERNSRKPKLSEIAGITDEVV